MHTDGAVVCITPGSLQLVCTHIIHESSGKEKTVTCI